MNNKKQKPNKTYIGGQAVMEGVMMRGKKSMATAVRDSGGVIRIESERLVPPEKKSRFSRIPFVRGVVNFVSSLVIGNRVLMRSAEVVETEDETPSKAEKWLAEKHKINLTALLNTLAMIVGIVLALVLFVALPQFLAGLTGFDKQGLEGLYFNLIEGGIRIGIFVLYILGISLIPDLKRVFMYHGAEHKTITAYERGLELTMENVRSCSRVHDRCGTTFLFLVMAVSILVFSLANSVVGRWIYTGNGKIDFLIRFCFKLLLLPFVAGGSYEILRLLAKTESVLVLPLKLPGLLLQRITTREPDDKMIECAIVAFTEVLKMDADDSVPEKVFVTGGKMNDLLKNTKKRFAHLGIDEDEAEWIFSLTMDIPKSAVSSEERILKIAKAREIIAIADERLTGRPLWYIFGDTDFRGYKIKVDERVLIPRPETEELVSLALSAVEENMKVLDLCTGSGAIAISVYKEAQKNKRNVTVYASDISKGALELAKENAESNGADIHFIESDLFSRIRTRFDLIITNPPYIPSATIGTLQREVKDFEPLLALDGGEDGLDFYRRIAQDASKCLSRGGVLIAEVGEGQADKVAKLFKYAEYTMIVKDFNGVERFVKVVF